MGGNVRRTFTELSVNFRGTKGEHRVTLWHRLYGAFTAHTRAFIFPGSAGAKKFETALYGVLQCIGKIRGYRRILTHVNYMITGCSGSACHVWATFRNQFQVGHILASLSCYINHVRSVLVGLRAGTSGGEKMITC